MEALLAIVTAILFGSNTVAVRLGMRRQVDSELSALMPVLVAVALAVPIGLISIPFTWNDDAIDLWRFALAGLVAPGLSQLVFMPAVRYAGASRVGILIGMAPVLSASLAIALLDEPFRVVLAVATLMIVVGGVALVWDPSRPAGFRPIGLLFGALATLLFSLQAVTLRWASDGRSIPPLVGLAVMVTIGAVVPLSVLLYARGRAAFIGVRSCAGGVLARRRPIHDIFARLHPCVPVWARGGCRTADGDRVTVDCALGSAPDRSPERRNLETSDRCLRSDRRRRDPNRHFRVTSAFLGVPRPGALVPPQPAPGPAPTTAQLRLGSRRTG